MKLLGAAAESKKTFDNQVSSSPKLGNQFLTTHDQ